MRLAKRLRSALEAIVGAALPLEFSRKGEPGFACVLAPRGYDPESTAKAWAERYADLAEAVVSGGYLNLVPTQAALEAEMVCLAELRREEEPRWGDPHAAAIHRLRADRAFRADVPFDAAAAMAVLRLERGLPVPIPAPPLNRDISLALEAVLQQMDAQ